MSLEVLLHQKVHGSLWLEKKVLCKHQQVGNELNVHRTSLDSLLVRDLLQGLDP